MTQGKYEQAIFEMNQWQNDCKIPRKSLFKLRKFKPVDSGCCDTVAFCTCVKTCGWSSSVSMPRSVLHHLSGQTGVHYSTRLYDCTFFHHVIGRYPHVVPHRAVLSENISGWNCLQLKRTRHSVHAQQEHGRLEKILTVVCRETGLESTHNISKTDLVTWIGLNLIKVSLTER